MSSKKGDSGKNSKKGERVKSKGKKRKSKKGKKESGKKSPKEEKIVYPFKDFSNDIDDENDHENDESTSVKKSPKSEKKEKKEKEKENDEDQLKTGESPEKENDEKVEKKVKRKKRRKKSFFHNPRHKILEKIVKEEIGGKGVRNSIDDMKKLTGNNDSLSQTLSLDLLETKDGDDGDDIDDFDILSSDDEGSDDEISLSVPDSPQAKTPKSPKTFPGGENYDEKTQSGKGKVIKKDMDKVHDELKKDREEMITTQTKTISKALSIIERERMNSDLPYLEGVVEVEGLTKKKKWQKVLFKLYHKEHLIRYFKHDKKKRELGELVLNEVKMKMENKEYKKRRFVFSFVSKGNKNKSLNIATETNSHRKEWISSIKKYAVYKDQEYSDEELKIISDTLEEILTEFSYKKDLVSIVAKLEKLFKQYPNSLNVILLLSEFYSNENIARYDESLLLLKEQIPCDYNLKSGKVRELSSEEKNQQFEIHFKLGSLHQSLYFKIKKQKVKLKHLSDAVGCFEVCSLLKPNDMTNLRTLATALDYSKRYEESVRIWLHLYITTASTITSKKDIIISCANSLKNSKKEEKFLQFLVQTTSKNIPIGMLYKELGNIVTLKRLKKLLLKKHEFYSWVPIFCTHLKYTPNTFKIYQTQKNTKRLGVKNIQKLVQKKGIISSEFLIAILFNVFNKLQFKEDDYSSKIIDSICLALKNRLDHEKTILCLLFLFRELENEILIGKIAITFATSKSLLKKYELLDIFFDTLLKVFLKKRIGLLLQVFSILKDERIVPYLLTIIRHCEMEKYHDFRLQSLYCLANFVKKGNKKYIINEITKVLDKEKKKDVRAFLNIILWRFGKIKKEDLLKVTSDMKVKEIPEICIEFVRKYKYGADLIKEYKKSNKVKGCKVQ